MNRKAIIAVVALLIANNSVRANDTDGVVLRYGETISAGYGSDNQILTPYVTFPANRIKAFADRGCSVSAVRIGLAKRGCQRDGLSQALCHRPPSVLLTEGGQS